MRLSLLCSLALASNALAADGLEPTRLALKAFVSRGELAGIEVEIGNAERSLFTLVEGRVAGEGSRPVNADTLFCIGSCSKPLANAVMLSLGERGQFDVNAPVERYLPAFGKLKLKDGTATRSPAIWELLCHRGGIYSQKLGLTSEQERLIRTWDLTLEQSVDGIATQPLIAVPGTLYAYSGAAYCVAGRAAEVSSGSPFEKLLREKLTGPLGMNRTTYFPAATDGNVAAGLILSEGRAIPDPQTPHTFGARLRMPLIGGSLYATSRDLGRFATMMLKGGKVSGKSVLEPATFKRYTSRILPDQSYGFGWEVETASDGSTLSLSHTGSLASSRALLKVELAAGRYLVAVFTLGPHRQEQTFAEVSKLLNEAAALFPGKPAR